MIRPRFRSVRYSITPSTSLNKYKDLKKEMTQVHDKSIININRLRTVTQKKNVINDQNTTIEVT